MSLGKGWVSIKSNKYVEITKKLRQTAVPTAEENKTSRFVYGEQVGAT
ncbi:MULTISPECIES: hypothetical protein [Bhargavaea]|nr:MULTISPECIES: hypothetical protein [Bhargavaea]MCM3086449.1 hypothetical protein [Bhargavaea ginsengi]